MKISHFILNLQEFVMAINARRRIQLLLRYILVKDSDIILDVGGNTGKITEGYARNCKEVVVLEPKHKVADYGRTHRPHIRFVQGEAENIPFPQEYFDKIIASFSFHHFPNQDRSLEEMKRVLKLNGMLVIVESDPATSKGKGLKLCETLLRTDAKFYTPLELKEKVERCGLHVTSVDPTSIGYFLTATKDT
ncbi:MAG TPA: class I SAM-dependent methyltransferase [Nitrososphaeraceae archaeon]|nr:class I SAM-dependent methyltransferase [Nitrososphaeraceae archaeon]